MSAEPDNITFVSEDQLGQPIPTEPAPNRREVAFGDLHALAQIHFRITRDHQSYRLGDAIHRLEARIADLIDEVLGPEAPQEIKND